MPKSCNRSSTVVFAVLLVSLAGCLAYVNTLSGDWVWDDVSSVLLHKHVQTPRHFLRLFVEDQHAFGRGQGNFYRPLVAVSFLIDYQLAGGPAPEEGHLSVVPAVSPFIFHVSNIVWHVAAALCLLGLLNAIGASTFVLLTVPLIFVLHPLHTEAVAYISGRADMMSATGLFAALWATALYYKNALKSRYLFFSSLFFIAALLSKESSLIYPVLLIPFLVYLIPSRKERPANEKAFHLPDYFPLLLSLGILGIYVVLRSTVLNFAVASATTAAPLSQRLYETLQSLGIYLQLLFAPFALHMERSLLNASLLHALIGASALLLFVCLFAYGLLKKKAHIALGVTWFLLCWLPISGIFPLNAPLAEHWMYVPMAGFWLCLATLVSSLTTSKYFAQLTWIAVSVFALYLGILTVQRNPDWGSNERLFLSTLHENPASARVHYNLAVTYSDLLKNNVAAKRHYEIFLNLRSKEREENPDRAGLIIDDEIDARLALGRCLMQLASFDEALGIYLPMMALSEVDSWRPTAAMATIRAGECMLALGEITQANTYFQQAVALEPLYGPEVEAILGGDAVFNLY